MNCINNSVEETPEMLRAIDQGIRSLEEHGSILIEPVRAGFQRKWAAHFKSQQSH